MSQADREERAHNKGQEDYASDNGHNPPNNSWFSTVGITGDDEVAENKAYNQGYSNAKEQDK